MIVDAPFAGIAQAARAATSDLLVLGPHRRQALRDVFIGITAERTIRSVAFPCPDGERASAHAYRHALRATDFSDRSRRAARAVRETGIGDGAEVSIVHAFDAPALHLATAGARGADLIVAGTHGRSGLARFFLGSVAEEVLRCADRDVLAVPPSEMR